MIKFNWGTGLAMVIAVFMAATLGFVFFALTQDFDLVEQNYYEKSVTYQQQINSSNRLESLEHKPSYQAAGDSMLITLPRFFAGKTVGGNLHFYRAENAAFDVKKAVSFTGNLSQNITLENLKHGKWTLKLALETDKASYYDEHVFYVP